MSDDDIISDKNSESSDESNPEKKDELDQLRFKNEEQNSKIQSLENKIKYIKVSI